MKLLRVHIISADSCGGLLDGLDVHFRSPFDNSTDGFHPFCLIGPNGAGKSQFIQIIAEIFQSIFHATCPNEERNEGNSKLQFEIEYFIKNNHDHLENHIRISRKSVSKRKPKLLIEYKKNKQWSSLSIDSSDINQYIPSKVIGYTSGGNETLSLPFLLSRSGYAGEVGRSAIEDDHSSVPDTRLMLIDYGTHLEVLVANLLLGNSDQKSALLTDARLSELHSFRCIIQLNHSAAPKIRKPSSPRKGVQLTNELECYIDQLKRCATCYDYNKKTESYVFDFLVTEQTVIAFSQFWESILDLYSSFHKLAMLNDLAIPKSARQRFNNEVKNRRFASRLPEPQEEDKVFRFERVNFKAPHHDNVVDYVSLSDGEHQLAQLLGTLSMVSYPNVLLLLDEPESHFNPQWRVKFVSKMLEVPTQTGSRRSGGDATYQECILTTHAPFVPSDMPREKVLIFSKNEETESIEVRYPNIETFGTSFDDILADCFNISPPISDISRQDIESLMKNNNPEEVREGLKKLGQSIERTFVLDHLRQLLKKD